MIALSRYTLETVNQEAGLIETSSISSLESWQPPDMGNEKVPSGVRQRLSIRMLKGRLSDDRPTVKVIIHKKLFHKKDFFSEVEELPSDHLEEARLLYRISRELTINRGLERYNKKKNAADGF